MKIYFYEIRFSCYRSTITLATMFQNALPYVWIENDRVNTEPTVPLATPKPTAEGSWETRPGPSVKDWDFWGVMPKLTEKAVEWIDQEKQEEPFFLYFPFTSPHSPIVPTPEFVGHL